jgi:hypothetical protein
MEKLESLLQMAYQEKLSEAYNAVAETESEPRRNHYRNRERCANR